MTNVSSGHLVGWCDEPIRATAWEGQLDDATMAVAYKSLGMKKIGTAVRLTGTLWAVKSGPNESDVLVYYVNPCLN
jgi:hypothetical protein